MSETMEYLSDEELLALIETSEADGLLQAPRDLKENVLAKAARNAPRRKLSPEEQRRQFMGYCLRVAVGVAASLVLLLSSGPVSEAVGQTTAASGEAGISQRLDEFNQAIQNGYQAFVEQIPDLFDIHFNLGGNPHE